MARIAKTPSGNYKALIRKSGWPSTSKIFRIKRDAEDWARRIEDEMVRGVYIQRSSSERLTLSDQEVSAISGHKSMQMLRRYTHLRGEDLVAKLDETDVG